MRNLRFLVLFILILLIGFFFSPRSVNAAALQGLKDTITTSRPSAASPLSASPSSGAGSVSVFNNNSRYLASDSARIVRTSTGATITSGLNVSSQSGALTSVYFTNTLGAAAQAGTDVLIVPITAVHHVTFTTSASVPIGGTINIQFPGSITNPNTATPSATVFNFNGLPTNRLQVFGAGSTTCTFSITLSSNTITCTTGAAVLAGGTTITILIGCSSAAAATCATANQTPYLINPTKTTSAGTADTWSVDVNTKDGGGTVLDSGRTKIGTIETVQVFANVDASLTFAISSLNAGDAANLGNTTGCSDSETLTDGSNTDPTVVNLGNVSSANISRAGQLITVSTNGQGGYTLTATSSGHLTNFASGFFVADSTTPATMTAGTPWFGIHPCGLDVSSATWGNSSTTVNGGTGKVGWPTQTTSVTVASDSTGPIGNVAALGLGNGLTSVVYAATIDVTIPAGQYQSAITYVATPAF